MPLLRPESEMWNAQMREPIEALTDHEIEEKYHRGEGRIVVENNREKLPGFVDQLERHDYMDLRPFYQRRPRWDTTRQSRLIESFIINVPVPPVFLYERDYNSFEVMDGQQRITAIRDFYQNKFPLKDLQYWPELNGRYYHNLPNTVRAGIDRRSISSIVMLRESAPEDDEAILLRQIVFERLNTGGIALKRQEIRNALYQGDFNEALLRMSTHPVIRKSWGLPQYDPDEITRGDKRLLGRPFYAEMEDVELVLRFFALRNVERYRGGMQPFLDIYMVRSKAFSPSDVTELESLFRQTIELVSAIYGDFAFRSFDGVKLKWTTAPQKAVFDAVMVGLSDVIDRGQLLYERRSDILEATVQMFRDQPPGTFTGRGNTKGDIINRIRLFRELFQAFAV